ncbi:hypothetical protein HY498_03360 [Candidatus Woesearchaeota archaeon]|nr:hypothetical protein [Candidatus Woesearchaeota archaeon]
MALEEYSTENLNPLLREDSKYNSQGITESLYNTSSRILKFFVNSPVAALEGLEFILSYSSNQTPSTLSLAFLGFTAFKSLKNKAEEIEKSSKNSFEKSLENLNKTEKR